MKTWKQDLQASLVVFLVALPLCLGIALASNAPLASGLYAGIIGGLVVGFLSGSHVSVSGPAAGLAVIVTASIATLGSFQAFTLAVMLSGIIQIIFGFLRGGKIGNFFPSSVVKGMLAAIGIILILKQIPHAVGYDVDFMGNDAFFEKNGENTFSQILIAFYRLHPGAIIIAGVCLILMMTWDMLANKKIKIFQLVPGALVSVFLAIGLNHLFGSYFPDLLLTEDHLVSLPFEGGIQEFIMGFSLPDWSHLQSPQVYVVALTIAIVGSLETLLSLDAADKIDPHARVSGKNRELFAQGIGNSLSGLIGGLPITAVIVRTSANVNSGAQTKLSAILHGLWLSLCVIVIPHLLKLIPLSALAAVLILVGFKLTKPALIKSMYKKGWNQFIPFIITILAILFTDLLVGISIGMIVGLIFIIRTNSKQSIVSVSEGNLHLIRFHKDVSFLQTSKLNEIFEKIPTHSSVIIDGSYSVYIDNDIVEAIEDFMKRASENEIKIELKKSTLALCPLFKENKHGTN